MVRQDITFKDFRRLLELLPPKLTISEVAARTGVSYTTAYQRAHRLNYQHTLSVPHPFSPQKIQKIKAKLERLPSGLFLSQVAKRLHILPRHARRFCIQCNYKLQHECKTARLAPKFARLPPGLNVKQIARRLNITCDQAGRFSHKLGYKFQPLKRHGPIKVSPKRWQQVDWKLWDAEIARQLNISRERVRQVRHQLGKTGLSCGRSHHKPAAPKSAMH
ncbi:MAG: hypothetical protein M1472_00085 [Planctomycetes bacterium]|nr:hypothetical protein [Planctomycetota bacterium]